MSRPISQNIITKLEQNEITAFHLFKFSVENVWYYFTDAEVSITCSADGTIQTYLSRGFKFKDINYSNNNIIDSCSMNIDNLDSVLTALFLAFLYISSGTVLFISRSVTAPFVAQTAMY